MKKALIVATVVNFLNFEKNDIKILKELGYEVHCATNLMGESEKTKNIKMVRHQIDFSRAPFSKQTIIAYKQLNELLSKEHFDLIHCHTPVGGILTRLVANKYRIKGTKILYTAHGFHFFRGAPIKNWMLFYPIEWICSWMTDIIITINREDYELAQKHMHAKETNYIPGVGLDTQLFSEVKINRSQKCRELEIPEDKFILLSVGELHRRKNHIVVIEALKELNNNNIIYLMVGNGQEKERYSQLVEEYSLKENIKILGRRTDIAELCNIADCFVHPSIREGLGIAPLEAMAAGLPLIISNINGIKDYAEDGVSGCCINPTSVEEMKKAIMKMYSDHRCREVYAANNKETAKRFDISNTEKIMREIYCNL